MTNLQRGAKLPKWYSLYCGLAVLQFICLTAGLLISHRMIDTFSSVIADNKLWADRQGRFSELSLIASQVNAPGNDIFDTNDVAGERIRLTAAYETFMKNARLLRADLHAIGEEAEREDLAQDLIGIEKGVAEVVDEARIILSLYAENKTALAGQHMAAMDRKYSEVTSMLGHANSDILAFQRSHFAEQNDVVGVLRRLELVGAFIIVAMLSAMIVYGRNLAQVMAKTESERDVQSARLAAQAEELKIAVATAEAANKAKSRFLANMSHEIRTPMNGVLGMTDLLLRTSLNSKQQHFAEMIYRSGTTLLAIINDILDISRIEAAKFELESHDFELRGTVESAVELLAESAQRKGLLLNLFISPDVPSVVKGDAGRVRQILMNLIGNAIKFTSKGEVDVNVSANGGSAGPGRIVFVVRDTGIGIPEDRVAQLFKPFQQADSSITRRFGGTGLGLSIARQLVEMMGGEIDLKSKPGEGTTVNVAIPLPVVQGARISGAAATADIAGTSILVVDDRQANREILEAYIREAGGLADTANSGQMAVDLLRFKQKAGAPYDVAIIDMMLPDMTGFDVVRNTRAAVSKLSTRLIMLSSGAAPEQAREASDLGFHAFLMKPILRRDLVDVIKQAIGAPLAAECEPVTAATGQSVFGAHVLVAEDNPVNLEVAKQYLLDLGCSVETVVNGEEAVAACKARTYDLVLMDCQMPVLDGLSATEQIREFEHKAGRRTRIIAVTANAYEDDRRACLDAGMDDYLSKPFSPAQLSDMLCKWVDKRAEKVSAPAGTGAAPALDPEYVASAKGSRPEFFDRLLDLFMSFAPGAMSQLAAAAAARDSDTIARLAHSLRSSGANVGALMFAGICGKLEQAARTAWQDETIQRLTGELEREFARVAAGAGEARTQSMDAAQTG